MPDLDRTTLLKLQQEFYVQIAHRLRDAFDHGRAATSSPAMLDLITGETKADIARVFDLLAPSEAPAEAFTAEQVEQAALAFEQRRFSGSYMGEHAPVGIKEIAAMLTDYARLVRERHTGKGSNGSEV